MADNMDDVPPLEDMTEVLKQVDAIRQQRDGHGNANGQGSKQSSAKQKAKVNKKNVGGRAVAPETLVAEEKKTLGPEPPAKPLSDKTGPSPCTQSTAPTKSASTGGMFGGMKKGFLFGGPAKPGKKSTTQQASSASTTSSVQSSNSSNADVKKPSPPKVEAMPYITPSGKTESGLTLDEVQQAMSETKGLLDNQEWITDDFLNKIEGNELLLKRFSDPSFMKALQEFQTNPQAAMEKYKGNTEVEKFLMEFCGMLGDHFTKLGDSSATPAKTPSKTQPKSSPTPKPQEKCKIVELDDNNQPVTDKPDLKNTSKPKVTPKIVEITDSVDSETLTNLKTAEDTKPAISEIKTRRNEAEIKAVPKIDDADVKEVLNDSKVMEVLLDPQIMSLIQTLRSDPEAAQRIMDSAGSDLKEKIQFLVSKGLLQFQNR